MQRKRREKRRRRAKKRRCGERVVFPSFLEATQPHNHRHTDTQTHCMSDVMQEEDSDDDDDTDDDGDTADKGSNREKVTRALICMLMSVPMSCFIVDCMSHAGGLRQRGLRATAGAVKSIRMNGFDNSIGTQLCLVFVIRLTHRHIPPSFLNQAPSVSSKSSGPTRSGQKKSKSSTCQPALKNPFCCNTKYIWMIGMLETSSTWRKIPKDQDITSESSSSSMATIESGPCNRSG